MESTMNDERPKITFDIKKTVPKWKVYLQKVKFERF